MTDTGRERGRHRDREPMAMSWVTFSEGERHRLRQLKTGRKRKARGIIPLVRIPLSGNSLEFIIFFLVWSSSAPGTGSNQGLFYRMWARRCL